MPPSPPALVFDLDGTLIDSVHDIAAGLNCVLAEMGRRALDSREVACMIGDGAAVLVARGFEATGGPDPDMPARVAHFLAVYESMSTAQTLPFPGVLATLEALRSSGTAMGICTNKPIAPTRIVLRDLEIDHFFSAIVGGDSGPTRKPDGGPLRDTLDLMGADTAVMVGDSINDVATARAVGIPVIVMRYGYTRIPHDELGADLLLDRFDDIPGAAIRLLAEAAER